LAEEAGIPDGVFNVLPCSRDKSPEVTAVIMDSDLVTNFSFTGSTETGQVSKTCWVALLLLITEQANWSLPLIANLQKVYSFA
jgi:delta 1-pyrroline-5-carboxylate dehydrogenase